MSVLRRFDRKARDVLDELYVDGRSDTTRGVNYHADLWLEHAVNTALALGRPLLVSGEPGCGKTELGFAVARKLGVSRVHFFAVKSDSEAQRLFYDYDPLGRFHVAQLGGELARTAKGEMSASDPRRFIRYHALGRAILDASPKERIAHLLAPGEKPIEKPERSLVIIDEIDKAPRDFPNDLLTELDQLWFRVPELAGAVEEASTPREPIAKHLRPIIVITSNLERQLPDAFLRRCAFHHIEHPDDETLQREILLGHLSRAGAQMADGDVGAAIALVANLRKQGMIKPPGLAELIEFVRAMALRQEEFANASFGAKARACVSALAKATDDRKLVLDVVGALEGGTFDAGGGEGGQARGAEL